VYMFNTSKHTDLKHKTDKYTDGKWTQCEVLPWVCGRRRGGGPVLAVAARCPPPACAPSCRARQNTLNTSQAEGFRLRKRGLTNV
jgi:hypothetical protein